MKYLGLFLVAILVVNSSCTAMKDGKPTIKQGVYGKLIWQEGNRMPSPDAPSLGMGKPVQKKISIYELTNLNQVSGTAPLFSANRAKLVAETISSKEGDFECKLEPGLYSIFTEEPNQLLFANSFNGQGDIMRFEIKKGQLTQVNIIINCKAAF